MLRVATKLIQESALHKKCAEHL